MNGGITSARAWLPDGTHRPFERVRIIGKRIRFWFSDNQNGDVPEFFDRQLRAFGKDIQRLLAHLRVGVVGVGGIGSCVTEQLVRLGVGHLLLADGETFDPSNVIRVYGSRAIDATIQKVKITGFMGAERESTEVIHLIDQTRLRTNAVPPREGCFCADKGTYWGRSDVLSLS